MMGAKWDGGMIRVGRLKVGEEDVMMCWAAFGGELGVEVWVLVGVTCGSSFS